MVIPYGCSVVSVFTESGDEGEEGGLTIDQKAVAEIWLLSLSHTLLIRLGEGEVDTTCRRMTTLFGYRC